MKTPTALIAASCLAMAAALHATPDRMVAVTESLIGVGDGSYAILRTQVDNLGSYYSDRENHWLDEYDFGTKEKRPVKSIHLLDVTSSIDANHTDPNTSPAVERVVHHKDDSQSLADLLARFPVRNFHEWPAERMEDVSSHPQAGIRYKNRVFLMDAGVIDAAFPATDKDAPWTLEAVVEAGDHLLLRVAKFRDEARDVRIFHVTPEDARLVRDQTALKPLYLVAGTFDTIDEAIRTAREMRVKSRNAKFYSFHPEIWEARLPTDRTVFMVAEEHSMELIQSGRLSKAVEILGTDLVPTSSGRFLRRTRVPE